MKRVIIGEKCIGCGICLHNKKYIEETTDGIARAIPGMMVTDKDLPDLEEIERICPIHELHLSPIKRKPPIRASFQNQRNAFWKK